MHRYGYIYKYIYIKAWGQAKQLSWHAQVPIESFAMRFVFLNEQNANHPSAPVSPKGHPHPLEGWGWLVRKLTYHRRSACCPSSTSLFCGTHFYDFAL